jgi:hypothetical protein
MFAPPAGAGGGLGLSLEDLRQAFREFDLDKNGCGAARARRQQARAGG